MVYLDVSDILNIINRLRLKKNHNVLSVKKRVCSLIFLFNWSYKLCYRQTVFYTCTEADYSYDIPLPLYLNTERVSVSETCLFLA